MALPEWNENMALHLPAIDTQHKQLLAWIKALGDAVQKEEGARIIDDVLQHLINYVHEHFSAEERLMLAHNFPGFADHRREHDFFVSRLKDLHTGITCGEELSVKTLDFLVDWTITHIRGTDQKYGSFVRATAVGAKLD
ncbi:bacteriohemerythrin [Geobacter sp. FeAm09]|uniref:bacteriohemerythrin n=1 Tax=Geobacter sp. FeAm09 TaxID=2597769 RepID=UPI0011EFF508|nr:bacteriohemerythrin [Geobacter sp. FeAm09]QEM66815.1 bacteriohemerythrin [Geobacter sp. FeAm09]